MLLKQNIHTMKWNGPTANPLLSFSEVGLVINYPVSLCPGSAYNAAGSKVC
jgi:hypothetical protein